MVLVACIGLASSANLAAAELFSATRAVIAILADDLFVGEAEGHLSGAGTLAIHSQKDPALTCVGQFTSSAALGGSGQLQCSDGTIATFHFQRLSVFQRLRCRQLQPRPDEFCVRAHRLKKPRPT